MELNSQNLPQGITAEQVQSLLQSPTGKQLLSSLQANGGSLLRQAIRAAQDGDYEQVRALCEPLLESANAPGSKKESDRKRG